MNRDKDAKPPLPKGERVDYFFSGSSFYNVRTFADKDYTALEPTPPMDEEQMEEARKLYELPREKG